MKALLLTFTCAVAALTGFAQWQTIGTEGFSAGSPQYLDLAVDNGTPYVAYKDAANGEKCTVMKFNGGNWITVGNAGFTEGIARDQSLAVANGQPYVAFTDAHNSNKPRVMTFNGTTWEYVGDVVSNGASYGTSICVADSIIYVAYVGAGYTYLHKFADSTWSQVGFYPASIGSAPDVDMAIHPTSGLPYLVYKDNYNFGKATVVKPTSNGGWDNVGTMGFSTNQVSTTRIAFKDDIPYVSFRDVATDKITVMKYEGGWTVVGSEGFSAGSIATPDIAIHNGIAHVAYSDVVDSEKAAVLSYNGAGWSAKGSAISDGKATGQRLVSSGGELYLAYRDWANGEKVTVKQYLDCNVNMNVTQVGATLTATNTTTGATYQWMDCNTFAAIPGATSASYTAAANGSYAVIISEGLCTDTSACTGISNVGVDEPFAAVVHLYPNPASTVLNIVTSEPVENITIHDLSGALVLQSRDKQVLVDALGCGLYLVKIETAHGIVHGRFVKR